MLWRWPAHRERQAVNPHACFAHHGASVTEEGGGSGSNWNFAPHAGSGPETPPVSAPHKRSTNSHP
jgi:hypothetical protein